MKKHILLSVFLGCMITTYLFPQSESVESQKDEAETEVIIEKIIIDENGNETKYVIKKKGGDIISDEDVKKHIMIEIDNHGNHEIGDVKELLFMHGIEESDISAKGKACNRQPYPKKFRFHHKPKAKIGVLLEPDEKGLLIKEVFQGSAAEKADLRVGDIILKAEDRKCSNLDILFDVLREMQADDKLGLEILRDGKTKKKNIILGGTRSSSSMSSLLEKPCLGGMFGSSDNIVVRDIFEGSGAEKAGIKSGDIILAIDGQQFERFSAFHDNILGHNPGDEVEIELLRKDKTLKLDATIGIWKDNKVCVLPYKTNMQQINQSPSKTWTSKNLEVYPVPARDQINLSFHAEAGVPVEISMHDVSGKLIFSDEITDFEGHIRKDYSLDSASSGMAVISIQQGDQVLNRQILIQ